MDLQEVEVVDNTVYVHNVYCTAMGKKSLLVHINGNKHWIPTSEIEADSEVWDDAMHEHGTLAIPLWLAEKEGIVSDVDDDLMGVDGAPVNGY